MNKHGTEIITIISSIIIMEKKTQQITIIIIIKRRQNRQRRQPTREGVDDTIPIVPSVGSERILPNVQVSD